MLILGCWGGVVFTTPLFIDDDLSFLISTFGFTMFKLLSSKSNTLSDTLYHFFNLFSL